MNPYSYAFGNPVWYRDPSGLETEPQSQNPPFVPKPGGYENGESVAIKDEGLKTVYIPDPQLVVEDTVEHGRLGKPHEFNVKGYSAEEAHNPVPSTGNQRGSKNGTGFTPVKGGSFPPGQRLPLPPLVDRSRYTPSDWFFRMSLDNGGILDQTHEQIQQVFDLWEFQYGVSPRSALYDIWQGFGGAFKGLLIFGHDIVTDPIGTNEQIQRNKIKYYQNLWQSVTHPSQTIQNTLLEWRAREESGAYTSFFNDVGNLAAQPVIGQAVGAPFEAGRPTSIFPEELSTTGNPNFAKRVIGQDDVLGTLDPEFAKLNSSKKIEAAFKEIEVVFGERYTNRIRELFDSANLNFFKSKEDLGLFKVTDKGQPIIELNGNIGNSKVLANTILHEVRHLRDFNKVGSVMAWNLRSFVLKERYATAPNGWQGRQLELTSEDLNIFGTYHQIWRK